jgi:hypothetical protein
MTTTEGHDMSEPMTEERLAEIRDKESRNLAKLFDSTVTELLAEVDRLRAALAKTRRSADHNQAVLLEAIDDWATENAALAAELKAAKAARFENNGVGNVAKHIQAETINDLRLN